VPRVDDDVVFDDGVAGIALDHVALVVGREMPRAERDRLVDPHIVTDDRGLADDDAGAVINEEARSDRGPRMDIDAGPGMRNLRHQPGEQPRVQAMQDMGEAVMDDGDHAGIADQDFRKIARSRVADEGRPQIADQKPAHGRQLRGKAARQFDCLLAAQSRQQVVANEQCTAMDLIAQGIQHNAQGITDEVVDILAIEVGLAIVPGKQRFGQAVEDGFEDIPRRRAARFAIAADAVGLFPRDAQLGDDPVEMPARGRGARAVGREGL